MTLESPSLRNRIFFLESKSHVCRVLKRASTVFVLDYRRLVTGDQMKSEVERSTIEPGLAIVGSLFRAQSSNSKFVQLNCFHNRLYQSNLLVL